MQCSHRWRRRRLHYAGEGLTVGRQREPMDASAEKVLRDIAYADRSDRNVMDVYIPRGAVRPPLVVCIHGGAFIGGDKTGHNGTGPVGGRALLQAGYAVAALNYRLAPQTVWPGQIDDLHDAFAFLRANAGNFGFDASRIAAFGPSAGAHLAAMAAITLAPDPATRLQTCVLWYPPVDFARMDADMAASGTRRDSDANAGPTSPESLFIGAPVGENPDLAWLASPLAYLEELPQEVPLPSFLIMHGAKDQLIARGQSLRLLNALAARIDAPRLEYVLLPDGTHGGGGFRQDDTRAHVLGFLNNELGG